MTSRIARLEERETSARSLPYHSDERPADRQSHADKMPRFQDDISGDPQRAWQRRANPVFIDPLHLAPKSAGGLRARIAGRAVSRQSTGFGNRSDNQISPSSQFAETIHCLAVGFGRDNLEARRAQQVGVVLVFQEI